MRAFRLAVAVAATVVVIGSWSAIGAGQQGAIAPNPQFPGAPIGSKGEAIYPAFEGWGPAKDGNGSVIIVGYYNRNREQTLDIPVGPNNRIEPGGPDMGQPTHFESGRHYGVFALQVPKDFGNKKFTWTLIANGQTAQVQLSLNPPYWVDYITNGGNGNTTPKVKFAADGPELQGPPKGIAHTLTASVNQPLQLKAWVTDKPSTYDPLEGLSADSRAAVNRGRGGRGGGADTGGAAAATPPAAGAARGGGGNNTNFDISAATGRGGGGRGGRGNTPPADITVTWKEHRGPGTVKFADEVIRLQNKDDVNAWYEATTTATFSAPGDYLLRAQINDQSGDGGGGDQCCWTNAHVKVTVK